MCWKDTVGITPNRNTVVTEVRKYLDTFVYFVESELAPQTHMPIVMGMISAQTFQEFRDVPCVYYNTEQLTREDMCDAIVWIIGTLCPMEVWDYSKVNVDILRKRGIHARHVPLQIPAWYRNDLQMFRKEGILYDVGFAGTMTPRRAAILDALSSVGLIVRNVELFGDERDKELAKCEVILNIHAADGYEVFESARCEPWLSIGVSVVSEVSLDDDPRCILSEYERIVQTTIDTIQRRYAWS